jgi:hypothetical protein
LQCAHRHAGRCRSAGAVHGPRIPGLTPQAYPEPARIRLAARRFLLLLGRERGVGHCWLIDPDLRTLKVFRNQDGEWLLLGVLQDDADVCQPPFDATTFVLSGLWAD